MAPGDDLAVRELGGHPAVFAGCNVAAGLWDASLYVYDAAHDMAAVSLLVEEAGGRATDRHGLPQRFDRPVNGGVLSNGRIHDDLVRAWTPRRQN